MTPPRVLIKFHLIVSYTLNKMTSVKYDVSYPYSHSLSYPHAQTAEGDYRRLMPTQSVGLRHAGYVIVVDKVIKVS